MADFAHDYTTKEIEKLERQIHSVYKEAEKDITRRMEEFERKFKSKEQIYLEEYKSGKITKQQFDDWRRGQEFQREQWKSKRKSIINTMQNANQTAVSMINGQTSNVFMTNANYMSYSIEHGAGVNFSFGIYDSATVANLIKNNPQLLPKWKINEPKDYTWSQRKINNIVTQGIIQGKTLDQITKELTKKLVSGNENKMKTFARTAMTGAQNAGRLTSMKAAKDLGIDLEKEWMATLDSHTRDSHANIDGERVPVDSKFSNGLQYPGEAGGAPAEVYNCRCTMVTNVKKYPAEYKRYDNIDGKPIENINYREWERAKGYKPKSKAFNISDKIRSSVTPLTASDDWFEYENANAMSEYIKTGVMPKTDINGNEITEETREQLAAEAELIQNIGSTTNTEYKTLYRGMVMDEDEVRAMFTPNEHYTFDTLSATTTDKNIASIYTNAENNLIENGVPVVMEIQKPDGVYGFDRDGTEVVIPKGSDFKVVKNWMDKDGVVHISLYSKKGKNIYG